MFFYVGVEVIAGDTIISYGASDLDTAPRVTDELLYTPNEIKKLQIAGFYRDVELTPVTQEADAGPLADKAQDIEGVSPTPSDPSSTAYGPPRKPSWPSGGVSRRRGGRWRTV